MKLNKETLKQIIKEELDAVMREDDRYGDTPTPQQLATAPIPELAYDNPDMDVDELVDVLLGKGPKGDRYLTIPPSFGGGFARFDNEMNDLINFAMANRGSPHAELIIQALNHERILPLRIKANAKAGHPTETFKEKEQK